MKGKKRHMIIICIILCAALIPVGNYMATYKTKKIVDALKKHDIQELEMILKKCRPSDLNRNEAGLFEPISNIIQADDWYPLEYACANGTVEEMEMLIDKGADVNIGGSYLLEIALTRGNDPFKAADLLIANGIDVDKGRKGVNYFEGAPPNIETREEKEAQLKTFKSIVEHSKKKNTIRGSIVLSANEERPYVGFLEHAIMTNDIDAVKMLVEDLNFDVNRKSKENGYPLALAKELGEDKICDYLISMGAHE